MCGYDNNNLEVNLKSYRHGYVARFQRIAQGIQFLEFDERPHRDCCFIGDLCNVFYTYRPPITQGGIYQEIDIGKNQLNNLVNDVCPVLCFLSVLRFQIITVRVILQPLK